MRTPLRKLLNDRRKRAAKFTWRDVAHEERGTPTGRCTCEHPRVAHRKLPPPFSRKAYHCTVKGCTCYIAANAIKPRPPREGGGERRRKI